MIKRILIANRGEIACRIIQTTKKMGIESVAVFSTADKNSPHVQQADFAYCIGEPLAKASYLNIDAIIEAAKICHADAIHPGYGFLSENAHFAQACEDAGIIFIGPSIAAIKTMGSKQLAKQILEKTSVPLTPGYHGENQQDIHLLTAAQNIGFPVLIKAANGGGGKGMRAVYDEKDFQSNLESARREAAASFADDTMIIEKLITNPRHVEIQVMADNHGQVVHLFERDCSIQRRHQKIIEEAPAPNLSTELRKKLAEAACDVARTIQYRGAGTVEFLVDATRDVFYFMEMNTRLQVEHPVTEMITGLDLVAWQINIADNLPLPLHQDAIKANGHAIECRIYAEDPSNGFLPSIGKITFLRLPSGEGLRIDSGVVQDSVISQYYDPMIAKLIVWGHTRDEALERLQLALKNYAIGGLKTNIPFLQAICRHPQFKQIHLSTDFLDKETIKLDYPDYSVGLLMAIAFDYFSMSHASEDLLYTDTLCWQMQPNNHWTWRYIVADERVEALIKPINSNRCIIYLTDKTYPITVNYANNQLFIIHEINHYHAYIDNHINTINVIMPQGTLTIERFNWQNLNNQSTKKGQLTAPMPATIVAILKDIGDSVKSGEGLMVLEAMKMEHIIHSPANGVVKKLFYAVGEQVSEGAELLSLGE